jgi:anti-sigma factor RsiW
MSACNRFDLLAYVLDDDASRRRETIEAHLRTCERCRIEIKRIRRERESFCETAPFDTTVDSARWSGHRATGGHKTWYALAAGLALAVGAITFTFHQQQPAADYRIKGEQRLEMWVQSAKGAAVQRTDHVYYPGERVQLRYSCVSCAHAIVGSIDSRGAISIWYPAHGDSSGLAAPGADRPMPFSVVLDDYLGKELIVVAFSAAPASIARFERRLAQAWDQSGDLERLALEPWDGVRIESLLITKAPR